MDNPPHVKQKNDTPDVLTLYEHVSGLRKGLITIYVRRLTGTPAQTVIESQPVLGSGLYRELQRFHGKHQEAEYEVSFRAGREPLGLGFITMPAEEPQQQGQVMPPPWQPPPQTPPMYPQSGYQQPPPQQQQPPPAGASPMDLWAAFQAMQRQQLELLQEMQRTAAIQQPQLQAPPPPIPPPSPPPPVAPPPGASPMDQWSMFQAMQRQQLELLQEMQRAAGVQQSQPQLQPQPQAQPQQPPPVQQQQPQIQTPPGMVRTDIGFVSAEALLRVIADDRRPSSGPGYRTPPGPRSSYYDREPTMGDPQRPAYGPPQPVQPVQREKTPMEVMRDALGLSKAIVDMADQIRPPAAPAAAPEPEPQGEDSPVRVIDFGGGVKGVVNASDGSTRWLESAIANAPSAFKFMGEQLDAIRKMNMEREARKAPVAQLPPGYVEVGPGYVPPEGFVAVPVGHVPQQVHRPAPQPQPVVLQAQPVYVGSVQAAPVQTVPQPVQQVLPDPPAQMPAPIEEQPQPWQPTFNPGGDQ